MTSDGEIEAKALFGQKLDEGMEDEGRTTDKTVRASLTFDYLSE